MLCKPKRSAFRRRVRRIICLIIAIVILLSAYIEFVVKLQLTDTVSAEMKTLAQKAVNSAVIDYLADHPDIGERLTIINKNDSGALNSLTADPAAVNTLKASVSNLSQEYIEELSRGEGISVPLGSFSGLVFLNNLGPEVQMEINCRSTVVCSLKSSFESGGVNQTLHHIVLTADVDIVVYNPFRISRAIHTCADFEIAQTVIVGAVPSYTYGGVFQ